MDSQAQALLIVVVIGAWNYFSGLETWTSIKDASFGTASGLLRIQSRHWENVNQSIFEGTLGIDFNLNTKFSKKCAVDGDDSDCMEWEDVARLEMHYESHNDIECYRFSWKSLSKDANPHDCFTIGDHHWYGGAHLRRDRWLIETEPISMKPFLSCDIGVNRFEYGDAYGGVLEPYWLSSKGLAIYVENHVPLHVGINNSHLCLKAAFEDSWYQNPSGEYPELVYNVCIGPNVKILHEHLSQTLWSKPTGIPHKSLFQYPIWSTWAKYKTDINQTKVIDFAKELQEHGFKGSQIEIDDMYTTKYGDLTFDPVKFPNPSKMTKKLHDMGFRVTSWITPFFNIDSKGFTEGEKKGFFVKDQRGHVPGLVSWWQGTAAILDPTNPDAVNWFNEKLQQLRNVGIDSFKFDAGESNFLPPGFKTHHQLASPNDYAKAYAEMVHGFSNKRIEEVRVGYKTQHLPIMVRMMDKDSSWGFDRGLKSVIPSSLLFGLIGYPFVLPDMIGGNAYNEFAEASDSTPLPEKELYIRWLELAAFLPVMQYSIVPWQYDEETLNIARHYEKIHVEYVYPKVLEAARISVDTGAPILQPLWWLDPDDSRNFEVNDQFLIENVMVAPVLDKGTFRRNIYLPKGTWKDMLQNRTLTGPMELTDYQVKLNEIAYFELQHLTGTETSNEI